MKRKFTVFLALCMLALSLLVAGCGSSESEKFVGTWQGPVVYDSFSGEGHFFLTIEKLSDTTFQVTKYLIDDGSKANFKQKNTAKKDTQVVTLSKDDPKVLTTNDRKKIILLDDKTLKHGSYEEENSKFTKKSDKILPFTEFNPLPGTPEPK